MPQILRKATAKSVILGRKNQKKVPRNPGGTDICLQETHVVPQNVFKES